jgi:hypothetical protein
MSVRTDERDERVAAVLAEYFADVEAGRVVDWHQVVRRHPEIARELSEFFGQRAALGRLLDSETGVGEAGGGVTEAAAGAPREDEAPTADQPPWAGGGEPPDGVETIDGGGEPEPGGTRVRYFGDYELRRVLGRGGMGIVFEAQQLSLRRPVALKMIRAGLWADSEEVRRFRNEAEAVANLDHPGIVPVFEVGQHKGRHYFSMKLVEGPSLDKVLESYKQRPRDCARLISQVAQAVHHAHQRGILHRDLKPSNILLASGGRQPLDPPHEPSPAEPSGGSRPPLAADVAHVTDFGLARRIEGDGSLSVSGAILGTPQYMSPEQASGARRAITTATDVYGLGAALYAMLSGRPPFQGASVIETLQQVREREPERPSKFNPKVPRDLEVITLKCLEKDPQRRYSSAASLADDLDRYVRGEPILARRTGLLERSAMWIRRQPARAGLAAASLVAALALAGLAVAVPLFLQKEEARREAVHQRDRAQNTAERAETFEYLFRIALVERWWRDGDFGHAREMLHEASNSRHSGTAIRERWRTPDGRVP